MYNRKHKLPVTIVCIFLISLIGFKDTGIFVKDFISIKEDGTKANFTKEEDIRMLIETDRAYFEKKEMVAIKDFEDNYCMILDEKGKEFRAKKGFIEIRKANTNPSRSNVSRKASSITKVIEAAHNAIGKTYRRGAIGPKSYDCSGLTYSIYLNQLDIELERSSHDQIKNGIKISKSDLMPGDLVFFKTTGEAIGHVGLYIGDGNMIHASSGSNKVMITPLSQNYYKNRYVTARRIIK